MKWSRIGPQCTVAKCSGLENTVHHSYMWQSGEYSTLQLNETNQLETTVTVYCKCIVCGGGLESTVHCSQMWLRGEHSTLLPNGIVWRIQYDIAAKRDGPIGDYSAL